MFVFYCCCCCFRFSLTPFRSLFIRREEFIFHESVFYMHKTENEKKVPFINILCVWLDIFIYDVYLFYLRVAIPMDISVDWTTNLVIPFNISIHFNFCTCTPTPRRQKYTFNMTMVGLAIESLLYGFVSRKHKNKERKHEIEMKTAKKMEVT